MDLVVNIIEARDLAAKDKSGFSDPFCKLKLRDGDGNTLHKRYSTVKAQTLNPIWNEKFDDWELSHADIHAVLQGGHIRLEVWDKDKLTSDDFLGVCVVPIHALLKQSGMPKVFDEWVRLHPRPGKKDAGIIGDVRVQVLVNFDPNLLSASQVELVPKLVRKKSEIVAQPTLHFVVHQARGLKAMDSNGFSDPYCRIMLVNHADEEMTSLYTEVVKKNLNPVWQDHFSFQLSDEELSSLKYVRIELWDKDALSKSDDFLGLVVVSKDEACRAAVASEWRVLQGRMLPTGPDGQGEVEVVNGAVQVSHEIVDGEMADIGHAHRCHDDMNAFDLALHLGLRQSMGQAMKQFPQPRPAVPALAAPLPKDEEAMAAVLKQTQDAVIHKLACPSSPLLCDEPDIEFTDHCREAFADIRSAFGIADSALYDCVCNGLLIPLGESKGKSGAGFYATHDKQYFLKTLRSHEFDALVQILPDYIKLVHKYKCQTLLPRFLGLITLRMGDRKHVEAQSFVLMNNVFDTKKTIHAKYDLKGSMQGRTVGLMERAGFDVSHQSKAIMKDVDFERSRMCLVVAPEERARLLAQIKTDSALLAKHRLMDYSLLVGVHQPDLATGIATLKIDPSEGVGGLGEDDDVGERGNGSEDVESDEEEAGPTQADREAVKSTDGRIFYIGIIDILQHYNVRKKLETTIKSIPYAKKAISCVDPNLYASRFNGFFDKHIVTEAPSQQDFLPEAARTPSQTPRHRRHPSSVDLDASPSTQARQRLLLERTNTNLAMQRVQVRLGLHLQDTAGGEKALRAEKVVEGLPAHTAGVREGDVIVEMSGKPVFTRSDFLAKWQTVKTDVVTPITVERGEAKIRLTHLVRS